MESTSLPLLPHPLLKGLESPRETPALKMLRRIAEWNGLETADGCSFWSQISSHDFDTVAERLLLLHQTIYPPLIGG